jgi:hypothetical protein
MITKLFLQHNAAPVEREEVEVERIDHTIALVDYNNRAALLAIRPVGFAFQPLGVRGDVFVAGNVDVLIPHCVELVEVCEGDWRVGNSDRLEVDFGMCVGELRGYGGWAVWIG